MKFSGNPRSRTAIVLFIGCLVVGGLSAFLLAPNWSDPSSAQESEEDGPVTTPPNYAERLAACDTAPLSQVSRDGTATAKVFDHATGEAIEVDAREDCRQKVELSHDPAGDMLAVITYENGHYVAQYFERVTTLSGSKGHETATITTGAPISSDDAAQRLAEYHSAK